MVAPWHSIDHLLTTRAAESSTLEYKASWSEPTRQQVLRTICAFANDLAGVGGGLIVVGVSEVEGRPSLEPPGVQQSDLDRIQSEVVGLFAQLKPRYYGQVVVATWSGRFFLVIHCPASAARPHQVLDQDRMTAFVRVGSQTKRADEVLDRQLREVARPRPFESHGRPEASVADLDPTLLHEHLEAVGSTLRDEGLSLLEALSRLELLTRSGHDLVPIHAALLFLRASPSAGYPARTSRWPCSPRAARANGSSRRG